MVTGCPIDPTGILLKTQAGARLIGTGQVARYGGATVRLIELVGDHAVVEIRNE